MTDRPGLDFSFSGLKTAVLTTLPKAPNETDKADLAASFQEAVTDTLAIKCQRALDATGYSQLLIAGGVGANLRLREKMGECTRRNNFELFFPRQARSEEHTYELQSLMRIPYAVSCLKEK